MSRITGCNIVSPSGEVRNDQLISLTLSITLVNNSFVCECVHVAVTVNGTVANEFTVEVPIGGGTNPTRVESTTPLGQPVNNPDLPDVGDVDIGVRITDEESGCGPLVCEETVETGAATATTGGGPTSDRGVQSTTCGTLSIVGPGGGNGGDDGQNGEPPNGDEETFLEKNRDALIIGGAAVGLAGLAIGLQAASDQSQTRA